MSTSSDIQPSGQHSTSIFLRHYHQFFFSFEGRAWYLLRGRLIGGRVDHLGGDAVKRDEASN